MATLVLLLLWVVFPLYKRLRNRLIVIFVICFIAVGLFYTPIFQQRFFETGEGSIKELPSGKFSGSGRFEIWPVLWKEANKHIIFGAGVGEDQRLPIMKENPSNSSSLNDYLRILFDLGVVGLTLYLVSILRQMQLLKKMMRSNKNSESWALAAAYLGLYSLLILSFTEVTSIHALNFMNPLFAIIGAACGLQKQHSFCSEHNLTVKQQSIPLDMRSKRRDK